MDQDLNFDTIIVGAGQSGDPLARSLAGAGQRIALIERQYVGGTCINFGCTPTKTMVASAAIANSVKCADEFGIDVGHAHTAMVRVRDRKRKLVDSWRKSTESRLLNIGGLSLIYGVASFLSPTQMRVTDATGASTILTGGRIVLNTGGRPAVPHIPGIDTVSYLDSTSIMELDEVPEHLVIIGGGYIACEFAQMFRRFGSKVTILQRSKQLLGREDEDVAVSVKDILNQDGISIQLDAETTSVEQDGQRIRVHYRVSDSQSHLDASHVLVATGRTPNTEDLNLTAANIETTAQGYIVVNDHLETTSPNIYATGDVKGGPAFTHISYDDYRILRRQLVDGDKSASIAGRMIPYTVFIDPQLGRIGITESEARSAGIDVRIFKLSMESVARAAESGETRGFIKAIVEPTTEQILGCSVLGMQGGEIMAMIEIAMLGSLPYTKLRDGIFAHPTLAECFNNLFAPV